MRGGLPKVFHAAQREEQEDKAGHLFVADLINLFQIEPWRKPNRARKTPRGFPS